MLDRAVFQCAVKHAFYGRGGERTIFTPHTFSWNQLLLAAITFSLPITFSTGGRAIRITVRIASGRI